MVWTERVIATAISRQTLARKCVVLVDNCRWTGHECDVLAVTTDLRIIDVEIKISRSDLRADADKPKWWHHFPGTYDWKTRSYPAGSSTPRLWPVKVWKHYYALPAEIWDDKLFDCLPSPNSGVLLMTSQGVDYARYPVATCRRRAKPNKDAYRLKPDQVMDIARLANLRMWDAYEKVAQGWPAPRPLE